MAAPPGVPPLRVLEEALGIGLSPAGDAAEAVAAEGAYYLERILLIPDDNFSIPEGEEDLAKAIHMVQEQAADVQILEQKTVLPSRHVVHEAIEDFLCNFLIKMEMTRTLNCFQAEWYELIQKGGTNLRALGNVPDVYSQVMLLEGENKNLKKDLKHFRQAAELKLHYASYEPTIRVLHEKHHALLKEKMLTSLERDRAVGKISGLQATLKNIDIGHIQVPVIKVGHSCEKENKSEGPTQKCLREAREENGNKGKMKNDKKTIYHNKTKAKIQEGANMVNTRSSVCPTPCLHQQEWRGNSQTWNKTTSLQGFISKRQPSTGTPRIKLPKSSYFYQPESNGRF
ncbi:Spag16 [Phodopus roborovskii]|uniref:Spag16 protein n=1 Tax=Phodopus roborovskii TaxID=109678 RepID=A0AAU9ZGF0_PHORO|nr:Spag16 [Phodopus roborovskii]